MKVRLLKNEYGHALPNALTMYAPFVPYDLYLGGWQTTWLDKEERYNIKARFLKESK